MVTKMAQLVKETVKGLLVQAEASFAQLSVHCRLASDARHCLQFHAFVDRSFTGDASYELRFSMDNTCLGCKLYDLTQQQKAVLQRVAEREHQLTLTWLSGSSFRAAVQG